MTKIKIRKLALSATVSAAIVGGLAGTAASAADLTAPSAANSDDSLTWKGITLYGVFDAGVAYQSHGVPTSGALATGAEWFVSASPNLRVNNQWAVTPNNIQQSFVGLKMEEALGGGWTTVGNIQIAYNPTSGEISDGCASIARNNGLGGAPALQLQTNAYGDSSRCGQLFNGVAYGGLSNAAYGTLTVGRQNSLVLDNTNVYDPQHLSYAFSMLGYYGSTDGTGDTETARWDDSVKYVYQFGPFHVAGMYTSGGPDTSFYRPAWGANAGATWRGFSVDATYDSERGVDAIGAPMTAAQCAALGLTQPVCAASKLLSGTIADTDVATIMGKYTFELGGGSSASSSPIPEKAAPAAVDTLTFYGGYERITYKDPSTPVPAGWDVIGGYILGAVNNLAFRTDKDLDVFWGGVGYQTGKWSFTGAYYGEHQNSYLTGAASSTCATTTAAVAFGVKVGSNCAGNFNVASFVIDYQVIKRVDVYSGVSYSSATGGFVSGFINTNDLNWVSGVRVRF